MFNKSVAEKDGIIALTSFLKGLLTLCLNEQVVAQKNPRLTQATNWQVIVQIPHKSISSLIFMMLRTGPFAWNALLSYHAKLQ